MLSYSLAFAVAAVGASGSVPAHADGAGAFIGGVLAAKVVGNMSRRTEAEEQQADAAQAQAVAAQSAPAPAASSSPEQRIKELDKLAAGGYISPEEYKTKKQAILDSM
jgi:membrane protease subunit (stomatin/prohibitin family)